MEARVVNKRQLSELLDRLAQDFVLVAPVREEETVSLFKKVSSAREVDLERNNTDVPPKGLFLPQTEKTLTYIDRWDSVEIVEVEETRKTALFGARPCDIKSLLSLDPVFGGKFLDNYYLNKREDSIIIGLTCQKVISSCFCYAFFEGPCDTSGADLMFTELGDQYFVEVITDKGKSLADSYSQFFGKQDTAQLAKAKEEHAQKLKEEYTRTVDLTGVKEVLDNNFELPYWESVAKKCIGCGICTYVCPTCHCFDIFDQPTDEVTGNRYRCWDSCMFPDFTLMAGGHNPRPSRKERVRNRFMHKLKYHLDRYNLVGCVGCGRCVAKCPVNIDITRIIKDLKEVGQNA